ncbi:MAG: hypothetical protein IJ234_03170, partial [Clostridia bacterium]|nr:hypothetical protein [Clostridia bacterium]
MKLNAAFYRFANDTGLNTAYAIAVIDQIREAKREGFPTEELTDEVLARMLGLSARRFAGRELSKHYAAYEAAQAEREDVPLASPLSPVTPIPPI